MLIIVLSTIIVSFLKLAANALDFFL